MKNVLTTASRDSNGEMNEKDPASIEKYTMSQQFFFRRGPQITGKAIVFLKAYLSNRYLTILKITGRADSTLSAWFRNTEGLKDSILIKMLQINGNTNSQLR
ncbi:MAG: hypothetical protein Ct9H300mP28_08840 [Pseudomonadota bacterium]|nr:MAG: hypothetical protein Ct9H300mP28_08840 [Pseudomonadota bacterium]